MIPEAVLQWMCPHSWTRLSIIDNQIDYVCTRCHKNVTQYAVGDITPSTVEEIDSLTEWYYGGCVVAEYDDHGAVLTL
jgi:hypothetical protein